jgi:RNA polymerase sigma factor (sigma-70 family)
MGSTDLDLLARYAKLRDAEAFAELASRHRDLVYGTCCRVLGDHADAEDVTQECFLVLARKAATVRTSVPGYLHRVAVHAALAARDRNRARERAEREAASMSPDRVAEPTWEGIKAEVDRAIDQLPDDLREPLVLHFLQAKPQTVVAEELGISQPAVSRRLSKAIERLRKHLGGLGLGLSAATLVALLETHTAEAAPAALTANLGRIALAGIPPAPTAGFPSFPLGPVASMGPGSKVLCLLMVVLAVGAIVQQAARLAPAIRRPAPVEKAAALPTHPLVRRLSDREPASDRKPPYTMGKAAVPSRDGAPTADASGESPAPSAGPALGASTSEAGRHTADKPRAASGGESRAAESPEGGSAQARGVASLLRLPLLQPRQGPPPPARPEPRQEPPAYPEGVWIDFRQGGDAQGLDYTLGAECSQLLTETDGVGCAQTIPPDAMYLQFETAPEMILPDRDTLTFEVEVYEGDRYPLFLLVESTSPSMATGEFPFRSLPAIQRTGVREWRWVRWQVTDPAFADPMRGAIRFRLYDEAWKNDGRLIRVSQVRVTHEAIVFRSECEAVLCGEPLPVTVEGYDRAGQPLPDGTEVPLLSTGRSRVEHPSRVILAGGKADLAPVAGPTPGTVGLHGLWPDTHLWVCRPFHVLAGQGPLEERTDVLTAEQLAVMARLQPGVVEQSEIGAATDDQGLPVLRVSCRWRPDVPRTVDAWLVLDAPIAGVARAFRVALGSPDLSVDRVWARFRDANGEVFSHCLELGRLLPPYDERGLECQSRWGSTWVDGGGEADGVMDMPLTLYALSFGPGPNMTHAELDVWWIETDVLAPALPAGEAPVAPQQP